jgi:transketolase
MALALKARKQGGPFVFAIIGDGESQEGQIWEAAMSAPQFKLDNLICFTDYNKMQIDGTITDIMELEKLEQKWDAFNWHTQRINGHDFEAIEAAITTAKSVKGKPSMIIMDTIKGKGCACAEGLLSSHNMPITKEQLEEAIHVLNGECE